MAVQPIRLSGAIAGFKQAIDTLAEAVLHVNGAAMDGRFWTARPKDAKDGATRLAAAIHDGSQK